MKLLLLALFASVLLTGCIYAGEQVQQGNAQTTTTVQKTGLQPSASPAAGVETGKTVTTTTIGRQTTYSGRVLAGTTTRLIDFNKADYDKAVANEKIVFLYFYANWCPTCRLEVPEMEAAFNELRLEGVVGFRVNFNDDETDANEVDLARRFGVAYQHTKVVLKNGDRVLKSPESWSKQRYVQEITSIAS